VTAMRLILAYRAPVGHAPRLTFDHDARGAVHFTDFSPSDDSACLSSQTPAQSQIKQIAADARIAAPMRIFAVVQIIANESSIRPRGYDERTPEDS
jgi:hypothetical protein